MKCCDFIFVGLVVVGVVIIFSVVVKLKLIVVEVWKLFECGCCKLWFIYLEKNGFVVIEVYNNGNIDVCKMLGFLLMFGFCYIVKIGFYVIEGYVLVCEI